MQRNGGLYTIGKLKTSPTGVLKHDFQGCGAFGVDLSRKPLFVRWEIVRIPPLTGCSSVWLECMTGGHEVAGSSPVTPNFCNFMFYRPLCSLEKLKNNAFFMVLSVLQQICNRITIESRRTCLPRPVNHRFTETHIIFHGGFDA